MSESALAKLEEGDQYTCNAIKTCEYFCLAIRNAIYSWNEVVNWKQDGLMLDLFHGLSNHMTRRLSAKLNLCVAGTHQTFGNWPNREI